MSPLLHAFFAQTAPEGQAQGLGGMLVPMLGIFAIFYFILIRPQQKAAKQQRAMVDQTQKGDEIITNSGFYATVVAVEDPVTVDLGGGTRVRMVKSQIARNVSAERRAAEMKTEAKK